MPSEAILVPVLNEEDVVGPFLEELRQVATGRRVYLLDSSSRDRTVANARDVAGDDLVVIDCPRGLAAAIRHGVEASDEARLAVLDGDGQHDPSVVPKLFRELDAGCDVAVGSRKVAGATVAQDWPRWREAVSVALLRLVRLATRCHGVRDPLSGCFALRREAWQRVAPRFETGGYKFLLDFLAASRALRVAELPINFRARRSGKSKVALSVLWELLVSVARGVLRGHVPRRWLSFGAVGALGTATDMTVVALLHVGFDLPFASARIAGIFAGGTQNYLLNNRLTFRDVGRRGAAPLARGWLLFAACQTLGASANWLVSVACFGLGFIWPLAAISGVIVGFVANFLMSSRLVWRTGT